jgi:acyl transferase domain-containing protein/acyl carrier protein
MALRSDEASNAFLERIQSLSPKRLALLAAELERRLAARENSAPEPVAVIGMACRTPGGATTPEEFWEVLESGKDTAAKIPIERWDADAFYDPQLDVPGKSITTNAGMLRDIDLFDATFFGISPREAAGIDPQQRILLEVTWEALENAGERGEALEESATGIYVGVSSSEYQNLVLQTDELTLNAYSGSGIANSMLSGRLSHYLGVRGPNLTVDTACSASAVAIHLACQSLRSGECNRALAGGVNLLLLPAGLVFLSQAHMLAADGRCKAFSRQADGFGRAEGCGMLVLKRLSDARADGDRILGLIRGTAINHDGKSSGLTAPNGPAQEAVIRTALSQARLKPGQIDYVEAHGTGTVLGDAIELGALGHVFGEEHDAAHPLLLGSVKTNVGHLEAAAGVAGLMKVLLAFQHETLPPHLHLAADNQNEALQGLPFEIPTTPKRWPRSQRPRVAGVSSFGFSGTNCHLVLEEPPLVEQTGDGPAFAAELITVSAKTPAALTALCGRYARFLKENPAISLSDFAYTANACRTTFQHRVGLIARSVEDAAAQLERIGSGNVEQSPSYRFAAGYKAPPVAFLFTGQGSQYSGMGRAFYERNAAFRSAMDRCDRALTGRKHRLLAVVFGDPAVPRELIDDTTWTQPALFAFEYSLAMMWQSWGVRPSMVLGHSLGEYVAACLAGILTLEEALTLAAERGRLMGELPRSGSMLAVRAGEDAIMAAIGALPATVSIAAMNGPEATVLSGKTEDITKLNDLLTSKGIRSQPLTVSHAFHSPLMEPMLDEFEQQAARLTYRHPEIDFASNVTGRMLAPGEPIDAGYWRKHVRGTVKFAQGMKALLEQKPGVVIEIGPNPILLGMAKAAHPELTLPCVPTLRRGKDEWQCAFEALQQIYLAGVPIEWSGVYRDRLKQKLALPTYPFQRERYWAAMTPKAARAAHTPESAGSAVERIEPRLYQVEWASAEPCLATTKETRSVVLVGDAVEKIDVAKSLRDSGLVVEDLPVAGSFFSGSTSSDLNRDREFLREYLRRIDAPQVVLLLPNRPETENVPAAVLQSGTTILAAVQQALDGEAEHPELWLITRGAFACWPGDRTALTASVAGAIAKVSRVENPGVHIYHADLPLEPTADDLGQLADLLRKGTIEHTVALREGTVRVPRLVNYNGKPTGRIDIAHDAAYLVTGAFKGLGLRTAQWLAERGAKELYLVGRTEPSAATREELDRLERAGVRVHALVADISRKEEFASLSERITENGSELRGILHAAGTLDDGILMQQTPERLATVFAPKVSGGWFLHEFSLRYRLDFFVLFSSAASLLGSAGQSNYAAANAFLDALAELRHQQGLPATSVSWGAWSEIGMATRGLAARRSVGNGIGSISPEEGMALQEQAILSGLPTVGALAFDWEKFFSLRTVHHDWPLLQKLAANAGTSHTAERPVSLASVVERAPHEGRLRAIKDYLSARIKSVLMLPSSYILREDQPFAELGLDSLIALELKNELQTSAKLMLPPTFLFEYPTLDGAAMYIDALMAGIPGGELGNIDSTGYEEIVL